MRDAAVELINAVPVLPQRGDTAHKGETGHVAVVAGSRGMSGAATLCALGAVRTGAGLVRVYAATSVAPLVAAAEPSLMVAPLEEDALGFVRADLCSAIDHAWADVIAIGPGLGKNTALARTIAALADEFSKPMVIDADGLNNLNAQPRETWLRRPSGQTVLTPHPGEMKRLWDGIGLPAQPLDDADPARLAVAAEYARLTATIVVLKGHHTVVTDGQRAYVNESGNPGMATGGMGDVLTGVIAALIGQGMSPFDAACLGVLVHGKAGDRAAQDIGPVGFTAREVADRLPAALSACCQPRVGFR